MKWLEIASEMTLLINIAKIELTKIFNLTLTFTFILSLSPTQSCCVYKD